MHKKLMDRLIENVDQAAEECERLLAVYENLADPKKLEEMQRSIGIAQIEFERARRHHNWAYQNFFG